MPSHVQYRLGVQFGVECDHPMDRQAREAWLKLYCTYMLGPDMREEFRRVVDAEKTNFLVEQWPRIWGGGGR